MPRALMTADFEISSANDFSPAEIAKIEEVVGRSTIVEARNEAITTAQMTHVRQIVEQFGQNSRTQRDRTAVSAGR